MEHLSGGENNDGILWGESYYSHMGLVLDDFGNVVVAGQTESPGFPTTPGAYDQSFNGTLRVPDAFVAKISGAGDRLIWSTFLGGTYRDGAWDAVLDDAGNPVVTGFKWSGDFPTTPGAYDVTHNGYFDVFVSKLSAAGDSLLWSTYLGGEDHDEGYCIAIDSSGNPIVAGYTWACWFPTTPGAYPESAICENTNVFIAKLSATGNTLVWSSVFGGTQDEIVHDIALASSGNVVVAGQTNSSDFPTTPGAFDTSNNGYDAFLAEISGTGDDLLWSSYIGGSASEGCEGPGGQPCGTSLALDAWDNPIMVGRTRSSDFPTSPDAYDTSFTGGYRDAYVAKLDMSGVASVTGIETAAAGHAKVGTPNPFHASTNIVVNLDGQKRVLALVYDVRGRKVRQLLDTTLPQGSHIVSWDGQDDSGRLEPGGVYFDEIRAGSSVARGKMILAR